MVERHSEVGLQNVAEVGREGRAAYEDCALKGRRREVFLGENLAADIRRPDDQRLSDSSHLRPRKRHFKLNWLSIRVRENEPLKLRRVRAREFDFG